MNRFSAPPAVSAAAAPSNKPRRVVCKAIPAGGFYHGMRPRSIRRVVPLTLVRVGAKPIGSMEYQQP
jgi:hypothetical protein